MRLTRRDAHSIRAYYYPVSKDSKQTITITYKDRTVFNLVIIKLWELPPGPTGRHDVGGRGREAAQSIILTYIQYSVHKGLSSDKGYSSYDIHNIVAYIR